MVTSRSLAGDHGCAAVLRKSPRERLPLVVMRISAVNAYDDDAHRALISTVSANGTRPYNPINGSMTTWARRFDSTSTCVTSSRPTIAIASLKRCGDASVTQPRIVTSDNSSSDALSALGY